MDGLVNTSDELSEPFPINNDVKQGCVLAPTSLLLSSLPLIWKLVSSCKLETEVLRRRAKAKERHILIQELQLSDDCALVTHSLEDLLVSHSLEKLLLFIFACAATSFGLTITLKEKDGGPGKPVFAR